MWKSECGIGNAERYRLKREKDGNGQGEAGKQVGRALGR
jgi:hypothetical protein